MILDLVLKKIEKRSSRAYKGKYKSIKISNFSNFNKDSLTKDTIQIRNILGELSKKKVWIKRIDYGEFVGKICCEYFEEIREKTLGKEIFGIINWIDKNEL